MDAPNLHATVLVLGDRGIMIAGASGSGKTTLALTLIAQARAAGSFARLVSDDQVFVETRAGRLLCRAPDAIAGLAEVPGLVPSPAAFEREAVVDLVVRLVPPASAPRYREPAEEAVEGISLASLVLSEHNVQAGSLAVFARLGIAAFAQK